MMGKGGKGMKPIFIIAIVLLFIGLLVAGNAIYVALEKKDKASTNISAVI